MNQYIEPQIIVENNIISVSATQAKTVTKGITALTISYEITLKNCSSRKIINLSITDSLWGIGIISTEDYTFTINVISCCGNITPIDNDQISLNCGQLIKSDVSYLDPYSSATILVSLGIVNESTNPTEIPFLRNTIIINGDVCSREDNHNRQLNPIYILSREYTYDGILAIKGFQGLGGPSVNYLECFPYSNTRCKRIT